MTLIDDIVRFALSNWILMLCLIATVWLSATYSKKRSEGVLPGPWGFPLIGVAPFIGRRQELTYTKWAKKYGDVIGFKVGSSYTVVLNSYDAIHHAFVKNPDAFSDRPDNFIFQDTLHKAGLFAADYTPEYISRRKFCLDVLGKLGFGKTAMENSILEEFDHMIQQFGEGEVLLNKQTKEMIMFTTGNIVFQVMIGKRYHNHQDHEFRDIMDGIIDFFHNGATVFVAALVVPFFASIPIIRGKALTLKKGTEKVAHVISERIEEHLETLSESDSRDFIDEYLIEMKRSGDTRIFSKKILSYLGRDFFGGGMETIQTTSIFSCLLLANRPSVMKKVHDEIDEVLGSEAKPRYAMREKMPFCHAVIKEIMRFRAVAPLFVPHCTSKNIKFRGYLIPKGATVLANAYAVHNDPRNWEKPEEFNPERHIGANGKVISSKYFIPFGLGPRSCPGRQLAEMEVFILFVRMFQRYTVIPTPSAECRRPHVDDEVGFTGLTAIPSSHTPVSLIPR